MPIIITLPPVGLTPKVAGIHWDDLLGQFRLKISFQLVTPFGTFPEREEFFFYADLASVLNAIKTIWAITTTAGAANGDFTTAPLGDWSQLTATATGTAERGYLAALLPAPFVDAGVDLSGETPYDGVAHTWGITPP
jgi:hypothetical protein